MLQGPSIGQFSKSIKHSVCSRRLICNTSEKFSIWYFVTVMPSSGLCNGADPWIASSGGIVLGELLHLARTSLDHQDRRIIERRLASGGRRQSCYSGSCYSEWCAMFEKTSVPRGLLAILFSDGALCEEGSRHVRVPGDAGSRVRSRKPQWLRTLRSISTGGIAEEHKAIAQERLKSFLESDFPLDMCSTILCSGEAAAEIAEVARTRRFDLIVIQPGAGVCSSVRPQPRC